jgi:putative SOS response-associated peptidase YedK
MCGRFGLIAQRQTLADYLGAQVPAVYTARYNIAPTTPVMAKTARGLDFFSWGLVPSWAKDISFGNHVFNARAETVADKPSFRNAFKRRRCLVPASGFYEWANEGGAKQPYFCHLEQELFCFAGLWELWQDGNGNEWRSCCILTTEAAEAMSRIHHRMPVVLPESLHATWLDHGDERSSAPAHCIHERRHDFLLRPVSTRVNNSRNDSPQLIEAWPADDKAT